MVKTTDVGMFRLRVIILVRGLVHLDQLMIVSEDKTVGQLIASAMHLVRTWTGLKNRLYFAEFQVCKYFIVGEIFKDLQCVTIVVQQPLSGQSNAQTQKKTTSLHQNKTKRHRKSQSRKAKKIIKDRKNKNGEPQSVLLTCLQLQRLSSIPVPIVNLNNHQLFLMKIVVFLDNYMEFLRTHRNKRFETLASIQQYYLHKHGFPLQSSTIHTLTQVCPEMYQIRKIKGVGMVLTIDKPQTLPSRKQLFAKALLQFQTPSYKSVREKELLPKIVKEARTTINPMSVLYDKSYSQKLRRIIQSKQLTGKNKSPQIIQTKIREYKQMAEQVQALRIHKNMDVSQSVLVEQMVKRTGYHSSMIEAFIEYAKEQEYLEQSTWRTGSKLVVNLESYSSLVTRINSML